MAVTLEAIKNVDGDSTKEFDFKGLSTDTKPSTWQGNEIEVNSLFLELDTGDFYYFNEGSWEKVGGGSSASNLVGSAVVGTAQAD